MQEQSSIYFNLTKKFSNKIKKAVMAREFEHRYLAGIASIVYRSPVGPISFNTSYYDFEKNNWYFLFNMGYLLFQRKAME